MKTPVQVTLDPDSQRLLEKLVRDLGWNPSRVVREGLRLLAACHSRGRRNLVGMGKFRSGVRDLGSGKIHLKNFGK
jgi:hypothetical protein